MLSIFCTISSVRLITGKRLNNMEYAYIAKTQITTRDFVTRRPYFSGEANTMYCVIVKASTIRKDAFMAATAITWPTFRRGVHVVRVSGCLRYIIIKHVAYMGSCEAAVKISTKARPIKK